MSYQFTLTRMAIVKTTARTCLGGDVEKLELLYIAGGSVKWHNTFENSGSSSKGWTYSVWEVLLPSNVPKRNEACLLMFSAASFTLIIAKKWKHRECPSTDEWINKCGLSTWWNIIWQRKEMKSWDVIQHEWNLNTLWNVWKRSDIFLMFEKGHMLCDFHLCEMSIMDKSTETESKLAVV